jgi:hypothetical protein
MSDEPTADRDVLANLPRTRPARRSAKRDAPTKAVAPKPKASPGPRAPAPKPRGRQAQARGRQPKRKAATLTPPKPPPRPPTRRRRPATRCPSPTRPGQPDLLTTALNAGVEVAQLTVSLGLRTLRGLKHLRRPDRGSEDDLS